MPLAVGERTGSVIRTVVSFFFFQVSGKAQGILCRPALPRLPLPRELVGLLQDRRKMDACELRSAVAKMRISHPAATAKQVFDLFEGTEWESASLSQVKKAYSKVAVKPAVDEPLRVDEPPVEEQAEEGIWARSGPWELSEDGYGITNRPTEMK